MPAVSGGGYGRVVAQRVAEHATPLAAIRAALLVAEIARRLRDLPPPLLGQHTQDVLTGVLGYSPAQQAALRDKGVI